MDPNVISDCSHTNGGQVLTAWQLHFTDLNRDIWTINTLNTQVYESLRAHRDSNTLTRRAREMGGLLVLLMKSLLRMTLLKGASVRRARNLYNYITNTLTVRTKVIILRSGKGGHTHTFKNCLSYNHNRLHAHTIMQLCKIIHTLFTSKYLRQHYNIAVDKQSFFESILVESMAAKNQLTH